jgi:hypothetical protein
MLRGFCYKTLSGFLLPPTCCPQPLKGSFIVTSLLWVERLIIYLFLFCDLATRVWKPDLRLGAMRRCRALKGKRFSKGFKGCWGGGQECPFYGNPFPKFKPLGKVVELLLAIEA